MGIYLMDHLSTMHSLNSHERTHVSNPYGYADMFQNGLVTKSQEPERKQDKIPSDGARKSELD